MWVEVGEGGEYHHNTFYEILKELINNKYWRNEAAWSPWYLSVWESSHLSSFFSSDVAFLCDSWLMTTSKHHQPDQLKDHRAGFSASCPKCWSSSPNVVSHKSLIWITYCGSPHPQVMTDPEFQPEWRAGSYSQRWWQAADECET